MIIDTEFFGYGAGIVVFGWVVGSIIRVVLDMFHEISSSR